MPQKYPAWIQNLNITALKAPHGSEKIARSWQTEAALRMLLNNLDPEVAENPAQLVVYGGIGKAARNEACLKEILYQLSILDSDHSLLVQSGKAVGVVRSHPEAPRVLIANSNLVPHWANWQHFFELDRKGLIMYGQMTAGSWIYIGTQGIVQGTYETFAAAGEKHYGKGQTLKHKLLVSAGLGGMGGAQALAAKMAYASSLIAEIDPSRLEKRIASGYLDQMEMNLEKAIDLALENKKQGRNISIGVCARALDLLEALKKRQIVPDLLTDQTSAHDAQNGYCPQELDFKAWNEWKKTKPQELASLAMKSMRQHVELMNYFLEQGSHVFDYGNNIRAQAEAAGLSHAEAFRFDGFVPAYIRPLFCRGKGPFRFVALSGDPGDIAVCDQALLELFPQDAGLKTWLAGAQKHIKFQGLPARICWLEYGQREKAGVRFNQLVAEKKLAAPIVIGRDHLDSGSVASPYRETEKMKDGSDAVSDWPLLNLMANTVGGASWVSFHHGGGVGMGFSQHAGMVVVADGSTLAEKNLRRVLHNDPLMGVLRHMDAGYAEAEQCAQEFDLGLK